jgi:hypothetical protein
VASPERRAVRAYEQTYLPTPAQELLLRAALEDGDAALDAWGSWRRVMRLEDADPGCTHLLPLVYRNLHELAADDSDTGTLSGVYRLAWTRNQLLFSGASDAVRSLSAAGIPTILLKGAPMSLLDYRDLGVRPMMDVDLLVHPQQAEQAFATLQQAGWTPETTRIKRLVSMRHAGSLHGADTRSIDLHWYSLMLSAPDDDFWEGAEPLALNGVDTLALQPADQLLHVCVHGAFRSPLPTRWVADAITLIRSRPPDWERLVERAASRRVSTHLCEALRYIRATFDAPVPGEAVDRLAAAPSPLYERADFRAGAAPPGAVRTATVAWSRYRRLSLLDPVNGRPSFSRSLQGLLGYSDDGFLRFTARGCARAMRRGIARLRD